MFLLVLVVVNKRRWPVSSKSNSRVDCFHVCITRFGTGVLCPMSLIINLYYLNFVAVNVPVKDLSNLNMIVEISFID